MASRLRDADHARRMAAALGVTLVVAAIAVSSGRLAGAATAAQAPAAHESYATLRHQIESGQVTHARINRKAHSVTVTLEDGRRAHALYPSRREPELAALLRRHHATVTQVRHHHAAKAKGHRLRYIALAILILLAVAAGVYVLARRSRTPAS